MTTVKKDQIEKEVSTYYGVPLEEILDRGRRNFSRWVHMRHVLWALLLEFGGYTQREVAEVYGFAHGTIAIGVQCLKEEKSPKNVIGDWQTLRGRIRILSQLAL